jgi:RNA recognition motif-containing protein
MMIRNIPAKFNQTSFIKELQTRGYLNGIDFIYLPVDFKTGKSLGYCFINFVSSTYMSKFYDVFQGEQLLQTSQKKLSITDAKVQGFEKNYNLFRASSVMTHAPPEYRPMVRCPGCETLSPLSPDAVNRNEICVVCPRCH